VKLADRGDIVSAPTRHAPDVPVVAAAGRHDGRMIAEPSVERPAAALREATP
jgi:hypothetical protein